jgi:outer membrane protein TolC
MLKLSREELIYNIRSIYINILSLKSQLSSQQEYIKALQSLQKSVKMEVDLGKKSTLELLKVQVSLQEAKGNEIKISSSITSLKASLISLMGVESIDGFEDVEVELKDTPSDTKKLSSLERFHISSLMVEKTKKGIKKANATYYPQLNLNAYYGQNLGPNDDTNKNEGDWHNEEIWQAGVNLKWNLFDFGSKSAVSQKAEIAKLQAKLDDTKTKLEFKKLITQANSQIESSKQNYESLKAQYRLSKESQKIEQIRFDNGVSDINDLLLSKAKTQLALSQMINAKYQYKLQTYYLDYLLEDGDKR